MISLNFGPACTVLPLSVDNKANQRPHVQDIFSVAACDWTIWCAHNLSSGKIGGKLDLKGLLHGQCFDM